MIEGKSVIAVHKVKLKKENVKIDDYQDKVYRATIENSDTSQMSLITLDQINKEKF